jgi:hypothetical protein
MTFGFCGTIVIPGGSDEDVAAVPASYCFCSSVVWEPSITTSGSSLAGSEENIGSAAEADGLALSLFWAMPSVGEEESG